MATQIQHIGEALARKSKLQPADLERALIVNEHATAGLGPLLVRLGLVSDRDLAAAYAERHALPVLADADFPAVAVANPNLSVKFLRQANVVPLAETAAELTLAVADPEDKFPPDAAAMATGKKIIRKLATVAQVERALDRLYGDGKTVMEDIVEEIRADEPSQDGDSIAKLRDLAAEAPIIRLVNLIIHRALEARASDIHIEPFENRLQVRYRIDGVLQEGEAPPARSTAAVISRVKIMAKLDIAERRLPQDGRIALRAQGKAIDLRVATVPTLHGESLVLRVLDKERLRLDWNALGFDPAAQRRWRDLLALPHGIVLVTGPTGSGKTTTLYAALQTLNTAERKILTVEDPVEYQLPGINQMQVKPRIGLDFAAALRAIVRQDPDVIMIGEMRDVETARIAVQSALTGHLVFSTLHTNDAGGSITRLLDMGVEDYLLTSTVNGILAQRLVRTLCRHCRQPYTPPPELVAQLGLTKAEWKKSGDGRELALFRAVGCEQCAGSGYHGRAVIAELLLLSEPLRRLILSRADGGAIQRAAIAEGMETMQRNGILKAAQGLTTIEEVTRVTQEQ